MDEQQQPMPQDPLNALLGEFGTRLNEVEEKQRLIKDRVLLIGENLISVKEENEKENLEFKKQISQIDLEIKNIKQILRRIVNEFSTLARKAELEILQRQMKMFEPLEFAKISDIKQVVSEELNKQSIKKNKS